MASLKQITNNQQEDQIMSLALIVYLASITNNLGCVVFTIGMVCSIVFLFWHIIRFMEGKDCSGEYEVAAPRKSILIWGIVLISIACFIPSKETIYTMIAAKTVQDVSTSEKVQELSGKSLEVLEKVMDGYLKDKTKEGK